MDVSIEEEDLLMFEAADILVNKPSESVLFQPSLIYNAKRSGLTDIIELIHEYSKQLDSIFLPCMAVRL